MSDLIDAATQACGLIWNLDRDLLEIVARSLRISLTAVALASIVGLPLGALLAVVTFRGRRALIVLMNALMGMPPVVVGLAVYLALSRSGPLGALGLLFTPTAMVIAQFLLVTPIIAALARQVSEDAWRHYREFLHSLGVSPWRAIPTVLWEARYSLVPVVLAGFGRASAEVGAVMIVGGNIDHVTRVMTTAIALETSKGDLALALGLGMILILLNMLVNVAASMMRDATDDPPVSRRAEAGR